MLEEKKHESKEQEQEKAIIKVCDLKKSYFSENNEESKA